MVLGDGVLGEGAHKALAEGLGAAGGAGAHSSLAGHAGLAWTAAAGGLDAGLLALAVVVVEVAWPWKQQQQQHAAAEAAAAAAAAAQRVDAGHSALMPAGAAAEAAAAAAAAAAQQVDAGHSALMPAGAEAVGGAAAAAGPDAAGAAALPALALYSQLPHSPPHPHPQCWASGLLPPQPDASPHLPCPQVPFAAA